MVRKRPVDGGQNVKVTVVLPAGDDSPPVSVVGDFNDWNPAATKLRRRTLPGRHEREGRELQDRRCDLNHSHVLHGPVLARQAPGARRLRRAESLAAAHPDTVLTSVTCAAHGSGRLNAVAAGRAPHVSTSSVPRRGHSLLRSQSTVSLASASAARCASRVAEFTRAARTGDAMLCEGRASPLPPPPARHEQPR